MGTRSVVIVGGGIAGGALGYCLAEAGLDITVLERSAAYTDRVRGELIHAWGVAEAQRLGLDTTLLAAG